MKTHESLNIPVPDNRHLLIDIDGTLIDETYSLTDEAIFETISEMQSTGWSISLSSDSSIALMEYWADVLGVNGSLIAEKGAVVKHKDRLLYDQEWAEIFSHVKVAAQEKVQSMYPHCLMWEGEPVRSLRDRSIAGSSGKTIVLFNSFRKCSFGMFVRYINADGQLITVDDITDEITDSLAFLYADGQLDIDKSLEYGLLILGKPEMCKRIGTIAFMNEEQLTRVGMIGNSMADFIGHDIATHYAVGNASPDFIDVSDFTSTHPLTTGVIDIMRRLTQAASLERR